MSIMNYSTSIDAGQTAGQIQAMLGKRGATRLVTDYRNGEIVGLSFQVATEFGLRGFELPVRVDGVLSAMKNDPKIPRTKCTREQATRVAWRIAKDWLAAQMALLDAGLATLDEVMMPYMLDGETTAWEIYRGQQLALEGK